MYIFSHSSVSVTTIQHTHTRTTQIQFPDPPSNTHLHAYTHPDTDTHSHAKSIRLSAGCCCGLNVNKQSYIPAEDRWVQTDEWHTKTPLNRTETCICVCLHVCVRDLVLPRPSLLCPTALSLSEDQ